MRKISELVVCLLIFATCVFVYQVNRLLTLTSSDNIPHALLAFNWLENHTLNFDNFRDSFHYQGEVPYFFSEAPNGHLTSTYPIGTAIITFPLYLIFFLYLKLIALLHMGDQASLSLNLTSQEFAETRRFFGKLAATICSAFSVVLFYLSLRLKFSRAIALLTAFTFAFATATWVLGSQDLRQHTAANLLLTGLILCLFKIDRTTGKSRKLLLIIAGCFCGLLPSIRLTSAIFSAAAIVYVVYVYRKQSVYLLIGLPSILLNWIWNSYYFGLENFSRGGYSKLFEVGSASYKFSFDYFLGAFLGQLISPSSGLFVFSPVLLFAIPGFYFVFRHRAGNDEKLLICLTFASAGLFLHYCFYAPWDGGGDSYGSRFLMDTLPVVCFLIAYVLDWATSHVLLQRRVIYRSVLPLFLLTLLGSTAVQTIGAFSDAAWSKIPLPLINAPERRWSLADSRIQRHWGNLLARAVPPIPDPGLYRQQLNGKVDRVEAIRRDGTVETISNRLAIRAGGKPDLKVTLTNIGKSPWFGYQTGIRGQGETRLFVSLSNATGQPVQLKQEYLYISGTPQSGEQTTAIGQIIFPRKPGEYQARLELTVEGMEDDLKLQPLYTFNVTVKPRLKK